MSQFILDKKIVSTVCEQLDNISAALKTTLNSEVHVEENKIANESDELINLNEMLANCEIKVIKKTDHNIIFQLNPKMQIKYAHMLIFEIDMYKPGFLGSYRNTIMEPDYANDSSGPYLSYKHYNLFSRPNIDLMDPEKKEINISLAISRGLDVLISNTILHFFVLNYRNSFKFFNWYENYKQNIEYILLFEKHNLNIDDVGTKGVGEFVIKPRQNVPYYKKLRYIIIWREVDIEFIITYSTGKMEIYGDHQQKYGKEIKYSENASEMINQFVSFYEFKLSCHAKYVEWEWNCENN